MFAGRTAARDMRQALARLLLCSLGKHSAQRPYLRNGTHRFTRCRWCRCDLVRTEGPWHRPKGQRIVWPEALHAVPQGRAVNLAADGKETRPAECLASAAGQDSVNKAIDASPKAMPSELRKEHSTKDLLDILERLKEAKPGLVNPVRPIVCRDEIVQNSAVAAPTEPVVTEPVATEPVAANINPDFMFDDGADGFSWESQVPSKAEKSPSRAEGPANVERDNVRRQLPAGNM